MKQELIWELMKQAGELAYEEHKAKCLEEGLDPERTVWSVTGATYEKFSELIVRECIGCCEQVISDPVPKSVDTWLNGGTQCIDEIKQHFGVEE